MSQYTKIKYEKEDTIALITLNNPPVNALSTQTLEELDSALSDFAQPDNGLRAAIIMGNGDIFAAGADIRELEAVPAREICSLVKRGQALFDKIEKLPKIVIAAINGMCFGGGNELAMSCDIRIASPDAQFGQPEIKLGLIPGWGGIERLLRLVGRTRAQQMLLTGNPIDAQKALDAGLISEVVHGDELLSYAKKTARELAQNAPLAVECTKEAVQRLGAAPGDDPLLVNVLFEKLLQTEDAQEGIEAFLTRRMPSFKGR